MVSDKPIHMTDKEKLEYINHKLAHGFRFAFAHKQDETLEEVLKKDDRLKQVRLEAERAAMQNWRVDNPNNKTEIDHLIDRGDIKIWDLRDEKSRLE